MRTEMRTNPLIYIIVRRYVLLAFWGSRWRNAPRESAVRPTSPLDFPSIKCGGAGRAVPEGEICSNHSIASSRGFVTGCDIRNVLASRYIAFFGRAFLLSLQRFQILRSTTLRFISPVISTIVLLFCSFIAGGYIGDRLNSAVFICPSWISTNRSNQSMKPMTPLDCSVILFATTPCRGLSPSS